MVVASSDVLEAARRGRTGSSTVPHTLGKGGQNGAPRPPVGRETDKYTQNAHHQPLPGHRLQPEGLWVDPGPPLLMHSNHTPAWWCCPSRQKLGAFGIAGKTKKEVLWPGEANR